MIKFDGMCYKDSFAKNYLNVFVHENIYQQTN